MCRPTRFLVPSRAICGRLGVLAGHLLVAAIAHATDLADREEARIRFFQERIEPILQAQCYRCHSASAEKVRGGLLLDSRAGLLDGGDTGPAVVPGKSDESLLIRAIRHEDGLEMPPKKPLLPESTISDFVKWVDSGAEGPRGNLTAVSGGTPSAEMR